MRLTVKIANKVKSIIKSIILSYPKKVQCNVCDWSGRHFLSDAWHEHIICPKCYSDIRHRLLFAAFKNIDDLLFEKIISSKKILHLAPEKIIRSIIKGKAGYYATADFLRRDCDFKINMSHMPEIENESFDVVIAFDVLEHVPDYQKALEEVHRILTLNGMGIFTVPQKDKLLVTYEDPDIVTAEDRVKHFGQEDHLRIFGDDFPINVESKGFTVTVVNESCFPEKLIKKHILFPPTLSRHPLATNYRKVFFSQKR